MAAAERLQEAARDVQSWRRISNVVVFYVIYLGTIMPLIWLPAQDKAGGMIVISVVDAVIVAAYWLLSGARLVAALRPSLVAAKAAVLGIALLAVLLPLNLLYHHLLLEVFAVPPSAIESIAGPFTAAGFGLAVQLFAIAVMPAIWEEIAFRGLIQGQLASVVSSREAVVLTAALFAIIHLTWLSMPYLFLLGLVLGVLRQSSGSLLGGMVLHGLHNAAVLLLERHGF